MTNNQLTKTAFEIIATFTLNLHIWWLYLFVTSS